jgi:hypothetical protein
LQYAAQILEQVIATGWTMEVIAVPAPVVPDGMTPAAAGQAIKTVAIAANARERTFMGPSLEAVGAKMHQRCDPLSVIAAPILPEYRRA